MINLEAKVKQACYNNGWPVSVVVGAIKRGLSCHIDFMIDMNVHKVDKDYYYKFVMECEGLNEGLN